MVKLYLVCPICGGSTWERTESCEFVCMECGTKHYAEHMSAKSEEVQP